MSQNGNDSAERMEARRVARETEEALVGALQDSDTPGEILQDELDDKTDGLEEPGAAAQLVPRPRRWLGAVVLAALAVLVARRRK